MAYYGNYPGFFGGQFGGGPFGGGFGGMADPFSAFGLGGGFGGGPMDLIAATPLVAPPPTAAATTAAGAPSSIAPTTTAGRGLGRRGLEVHKEAYEPVDRFFVGSEGYGTNFPMDVMESPTAYELYADVPGMTPDDVTIDCDRDTITVRGEAVDFQRAIEPAATTDVTYRTHRRERRTRRRFTRTFTLPKDVDSERVEASIENGVLVVVLPKLETAKIPMPQRITVRQAPEVPGMISDIGAATTTTPAGAGTLAGTTAAV